MSAVNLEIAQAWNNKPKGLGGIPAAKKQMAAHSTMKFGVPGTGVPSNVQTGDIKPQLPATGPGTALQTANVWKWLVIGGALLFLLHLSSQ